MSISITAAVKWLGCTIKYNTNINKTVLNVPYCESREAQCPLQIAARDYHHSPGGGEQCETRWGVKVEFYQRKTIRTKKNSPYPFQSESRKGVIAAEEWQNENNGDLPFFRDEGITNSHRSADPLDPPTPALLSVVMTWEPAVSLGEVCVWKGKGPLSWGFSCSPLCPWQLVLTGKKTNL